MSSISNPGVDAAALIMGILPENINIVQPVRLRTKPVSAKYIPALLVICDP